MMHALTFAELANIVGVCLLSKWYNVIINATTKKRTKNCILQENKYRKTKTKTNSKYIVVLTLQLMYGVPGMFSLFYTIKAGNRSNVLPLSTPTYLYSANP